MVGYMMGGWNRSCIILQLKEFCTEEIFLANRGSINFWGHGCTFFFYRWIFHLFILLNKLLKKEMNNMFAYPDTWILVNTVNCFKGAEGYRLHPGTILPPLPQRCDVTAVLHFESLLWLTVFVIISIHLHLHECIKTERENALIFKDPSITGQRVIFFERGGRPKGVIKANKESHYLG